MRFHRKLTLSKRNHPGEPACADYPWDTTGFVPKRWGAVLKAVGMLPFIAALVGVTNYFVFVADDGSPWFARIIAGVFDLFLIYGLYRLSLMVLRAVKYGRTRLRFETFPVRRGETWTAVIELPAAARKATKGRIELRQIEEFWEVTGRGKNRSKRIVHECGWSGGRTSDEGSDFARSGLLEAEFVIPPEAPATKIDAERPVFWELRVRLETPGPDFHQRYLVPLY